MNATNGPAENHGTLSVSYRLTLDSAMLIQLKSASVDPPAPVLVDRQILQVADVAQRNRYRFLRLVSRAPYRERAMLYRTALLLSRIRPEHRVLLWCLLRALKQVPQFEYAAADASAQRNLRLAAAAEDRMALAELANIHPLGHLIGGVQVNGFKSQGFKTHWGTRRKRRR